MEEKIYDQIAIPLELTGDQCLTSNGTGKDDPDSRA